MNTFKDLLNFAQYLLSLLTDFAKNVIEWLLTDFVIGDIWNGNIIELLFGVGVPLVLSVLLVKGIISLISG